MKRISGMAFVVAAAGVLPTVATASSSPTETPLEWAVPGEALSYRTCGCGDSCWSAKLHDQKTKAVKATLRCDCENLFFARAGAPGERLVGTACGQAIDGANKFEAIPGRIKHLLAEASPLPLRYDGIYASEANPDSVGGKVCEYLRFFAEGQVVTASAACTEEVRQGLQLWLTVENAGPESLGVSLGRYAASGAQIEFSARSREGAVDYSGVLDGTRLHLRAYSQIVRKSFFDSYTFMPW